MINGLEGIPRSGKSYEATVYHVLTALQKGYMVVTNLPLDVEMFAAINPEFRQLIEIRRRAAPVRGTWDINRIDDSGKGEAFMLFDDGHTEAPAPSVPVFGHVWDYYTTWRHPETGRGPFFAIDECHASLPAFGTPAEVVEWYKLHGHFNIDVLLMTQSFRDINQAIARLMGVLVKVRKADILGRSGSYIRKVHSGYRGAVISTEERKYKPQYFKLYKSHTQGNSVGEAEASDVKPFTVQFRRLTLLFWLIAVPFVLYAFWPKSKPVSKPVDTSWMKDLPPGPPRETFAPGDVRPVSSPAPAKTENRMEVSPPGVPDPFHGKTIHLTGWMKLGARQVYTFTIADGGRRIFDLQLADLVRSGYDFQPLGECAGLLVFDGKPRPVTCDAPVLAVASASTPIVVGESSGRRSDDSLTASSAQ